MTEREHQAELTDDALAGPVRVWQRRGGHRYSLDDTVTAFVAADSRPRASSVLDLGTGIGSVLLMLAYKLPSACLSGLEAQAESFELLARNVERSGFGARMKVQLGDLRDRATLRALCASSPTGDFELVTGTPPYQPLGQGTVSPDPQRAHARVELRGGVEAYVQAAAAVLAPGGLLVTCADARKPERALEAAREVGLRCAKQLDVLPSEGKPALFSVFCFERERLDAPPSALERTRFVARDERGRRTPQALALRSFFDLPAPAHEAPSPRVRERRQAPGAR